MATNPHLAASWWTQSTLRAPPSVRRLCCHGNYRPQRGTQEGGRSRPQTHYPEWGRGRPAAAVAGMEWGARVSAWPQGAGPHAPKGTLRRPHRVARRPALGTWRGVLSGRPLLTLIIHLSGPEVGNLDLWRAGDLEGAGAVTVPRVQRPTGPVWLPWLEAGCESAFASVASTGLRVWLRFGGVVWGRDKEAPPGASAPPVPRPG